MELYLINHTTPAVHSDTCFGTSDVAVTDTFYDELTRLVDFLPMDFPMIYTSPMKRCVKLALELEGDLVVQDDRLNELNYGDWEMKKWSLIDQNLLNDWMSDFTDMAPKNGESFLNLNFRVEGFWEDVLKEGHDAVAIITHTNVIRSTLSYFLEIPLSKAFEFQIQYGSVSKLTLGAEGLRIEYINR